MKKYFLHPSIIIQTKYIFILFISILVFLFGTQVYSYTLLKKNIQPKTSAVVASPPTQILDKNSSIFSTDFENNNWLTLLQGWLPNGSYPRKSFIPDTRLSSIPNTVFSGKSSLEYTNIKNKHTPNVYYFGGFSEDAITLEFSRKYETGYEFSCETKMNGIYALKPNFLDDAGIKPTGTDKYGCKIQIMPNGWYHLADSKTRFFDKKGTYSRGEPVLYCYHPEQPGKNPMSFGEKFLQNIGTPTYIESGKWYTMKMVVRANTVGKHDGVIEMWINNELKAQYTDLRLRDIASLKMNRLELSAWVGGFCSSSKTQHVWDDAFTLSGNSTTFSGIVTPPSQTGTTIPPTIPTSKNDVDKDGIPDDLDNCVYNFNPDQRDINNNRKGDECDNTYKGNRLYYDADYDGDGIQNFDNCPYIGNPDQKDTDVDEIGDECE